MSRVLCIDDTPDAPEIDSKTLRQILQDIYRESPYKIVFETDGEKGIEIVKKDNNIKLVLLDVEFKKQKKQGDEIAKELLKIRPQIKIIVLTRITTKGTKISFGHKLNIVHYVLKKDLSNIQVLQKLKNLSTAIIEDYENKNWEIEYAGECTINLTNKLTQKTYGIDIPGSMDNVIRLAIASPNKPVINPGGSTPGKETEASLNKVHNTINNKVLEETDWNTWGILSREKCGKGQLRLVIGSPLTGSGSSGPYVLRSDFEEFKRDVESRLASIEQILKETEK